MDPVEDKLERLVNRNKTPSVHYIFFDEDSVIQRLLFGYADIAKDIKIDTSTTYKAFSVTKTFTALAVLQLAEKGMLDIDLPAKNYLTDFPYSSEITVRQLLAHSAGIPNPNPLSWIHLIEEEQSFNREDYFKPIFEKNSKPESRPNEKFQYSNLGYLILGNLIEEVSGLSYKDYVRKNILQPLGLTSKDLDFYINDENSHARGYQKNLSFLNLILGFFIDKSKFMEDKEEGWKPFRNYYVNGAAYGGLIGKPEAFMRYLQELLKPNSVLISEEYKRMLFTENITSSGKETGMCLSWFKGELNGAEYYSHAGGGGGYYVEIRIYPESKVGSVIMFNRTGVSDERILDNFDLFHLNGI